MLLSESLQERRNMIRYSVKKIHGSTDIVLSINVFSFHLKYYLIL